MKKKTMLLLPILLILCVSIGAVSCYAYDRYYEVAYRPQKCVETADALRNPYQGWYQIYGYTLSERQPLDMTALQKHRSASLGNELVQLQINLREYKNQSLTLAALTQLDQLFTAWEQDGHQLIVRFLYDWDGNARAAEPDSLTTIRHHMKQAAAVVNRHAAHIYLLQGIFVGNFGEMNGSSYLSEKNMRILAKTLADATEPSIFLSVRTPAQWRTILKSRQPLSAKTAFTDTLAARLGLFNDGIMGSATDLGTYGTVSFAKSEKYSQKGTRAQELTFQNRLCRYVPNGGEAVKDNRYNDFKQAVRDLSRMHVSYLNDSYDTAVLDKWKRTTWTKNDCFYGMNGFDYIGRHLGYRYTVTDTGCRFDTWKDQNATLEIGLKNTGFSNSLHSFSSTVALKNTATGELWHIPCSFDNRLLASGKKTTLTVPLSVRSLTCGTYQVFYRLYDPLSGRDIALANDFSTEEYGYMIGEIEIAK